MRERRGRDRRRERESEGVRKQMIVCVREGSESGRWWQMRERERRRERGKDESF